MKSRNQSRKKFFCENDKMFRGRPMLFIFARSQGGVPVASRRYDTVAPTGLGCISSGGARSHRGVSSVMWFQWPGMAGWLAGCHSNRFFKISFVSHANAVLRARHVSLSSTDSA